MGRKATAAETEARVNEVMTMMTKGASRPAILQYAATKWGTKQRTTDTLIAKAKAQFADLADIDREVMRGLALSRYTWALETAMKSLDLQRVIAAQTRIDNLFALSTPPTLKVVAQLLSPDEATALAKLLDILSAQDVSAGVLFNALMQQIAADQEAATHAR